jgi:hypothetical protein
MPTLTRDWSAVTGIAPELSGVVRTIERHLAEIPTMNHVDPARLVRQYRLGVDQVDQLYLALEIARSLKLVKRSWGMISPTNRVQAQGHWDRLSAIPKVLYDTADDRFRRDDGTLIVVYRDPSETDPDE